MRVLMNELCTTVHTRHTPTGHLHSDEGIQIGCHCVWYNSTKQKCRVIYSNISLI